MSNTPSVERIGIIGGGFSGVDVALNILDRALSDPNPPQQQYTITIFNEDAQTFGGGIAYGKASEEHYTNIPVRMLSPFEHKPNDLMNWIEQHKGVANLLRPELQPYDLAQMDEESLVPRRLYQFYLQNRLETMGQEALKRGILFAPITLDPVAITSLDANTQTNQFLPMSGMHGAAGFFDKIVLATGHIDSKKPNFVANLPPDAQDKCTTNCWTESQKLHDVFGDPDTRAVMVVGTGLTAYDTALTAKKEGFFDDPGNRMYLVSRHGHEHDHTAKTNIPQPQITRSDLPDPPHTAAEVPAYVGQIYQKYQKAGFEGWAIEQGLRPLVPGLIAESGIPLQELAALIPEHSARINTGVVGVGTEVVDQIQDLKDRGQLDIIPANILAVDGRGDHLSVMLFTQQKQILHFRKIDHLVNAAGLDSDYRKSQSPLIQDLIQKGMITPDLETGAGIAIDKNHHPIDANGNAQTQIYVLGSLAIGHSWKRGLFGPKAVNIPTLRTDAATIANDVTGLPPAPQPTRTILPSGPQGRTAQQTIVPKKLQQEAQQMVKDLATAVKKWPDLKKYLCDGAGDLAREHGNDYLREAIREQAANHPKKTAQAITNARHWYDTERKLRAPNRRMVP